MGPAMGHFRGNPGSVRQHPPRTAEPAGPGGSFFQTLLNHRLTTRRLGYTQALSGSLPCAKRHFFHIAGGVVVGLGGHRAARVAEGEIERGHEEEVQDR